MGAAERWFWILRKTLGYFRCTPLQRATSVNAGSEAGTSCSTEPHTHMYCNTHVCSYLETLNIEPGVLDQLYKLCSMSLCSNLPGQIAVELMLNPPAASDPSGPLFIKERDEQLASLKRRGEKLCAALNSLTGVSVLIVSMIHAHSVIEDSCHL